MLKVAAQSVANDLLHTFSKTECERYRTVGRQLAGIFGNSWDVSFVPHL